MKRVSSDQLVRHFFQFQNELKLYHWRTESYARHKTSDALLTDMLTLIDKFYYFKLYADE